MQATKALSILQKCRARSVSQLRTLCGVPQVSEEIVDPILGSFRSFDVRVRKPGRKGIRPIQRDETRIPGILQARGRFEDVLLNVPIQPLKDAMNERYLVYGRRNKRAFTGPPMTIRLVDEEGLPMQNGSPFSVVRAIPGNIRLHPLKQVPVGVGFVLAPPDERIRIRVPVVPTNREKCPGLDSGGWVNRLHWAVDMVVDPGVPTPLCVTMDLSGLELRGRKSIADLEFPGKGNGCKLLLPDDELCIIISKV